MTSSDCIIIGGGVIGLSTALKLAEKGFKTAVFDSNLPGQESSWAGGGILSPLAPWQETAQIDPLVQRSQALYPAFIEKIEETSGIKTGFYRSGLFVHCIPTPEIDNEIKMRRFPGQESQTPLCQKMPNGYHFPHIAQVRNPWLLKALYATCLKHPNISFQPLRVDKILTQHSKCQGVVTKERTFVAEHVIVAAGAWSMLLLNALTDPKQSKKTETQSIYPVKGQILLLSAPNHCLQSLWLEKDVYLIPRNDHLVLVGSTLEHNGFDKRPSLNGYQFLLQAAHRLKHLLGSFQIEMIWAGLRPGSSHGIPWIGPWPEIEGLWINSGHFRYGLTMAPASAQLLSDLMVSAPVLPFAANFLPATRRPFALDTKTSPKQGNHPLEIKSYG